MAWTSVQTNAALYDMALTTAFTPPPECTGSFTQIGTNYWQNAIIPAPDMTLTSCYPSQFFSSVVGAANSVSLPPFAPLVCPNGWSSIPYNSTYIACCPNGFAGMAPYSTNIQRPLSGVVCYSIVNSGFLMDVTSYDKAGIMTIFPTTAGTERAEGVEGAVLLATGVDGFTGDPASPGTTTMAAATTTALSGPASTAANSVSASTTTSVGGAVQLWPGGATYQALFAYWL